MCNLGEKDFNIGATSIITAGKDSIDLPLDLLTIPVGQCKTLSKMKKIYNTCDREEDRKLSFEIGGNKGCFVERKPIKPFSDAIAGNTCKSEDFLITEVAYPNDHSWRGKFIEIYNPDCAGKTIENEIDFVRHPGEIHRHAPESFSLQGVQFKNDGFFIICSANPKRVYVSDVCDLIADDVGPKTPYDAFEITAKNGKVIDAYGYLSGGEDHAPVQRAVRGAGYQYLSTFEPTEWILFDFALASDMDPRIWNA